MSTSFETALLYADDDPDDPSMAPPIHQSLHFAASSEEDFRRMNDRPQPDRSYRRLGNPTQSRLENLLATLEGAEAGLATASGMAAISATLLTLAGHGDHVVAQRSMYGGTLNLLQEMAPRFGIESTLVDQTDPAAFERAITPRTRLIMLESPSNPLLRLTDLTALATLARAHHIPTVVDSTIATPVNQRPIDHGIDLVMHSVSKAIAGHSDVQAGVVLGRRDLIERIWRTTTVLGPVISPFDAWLALRGARTMGMRVRRQNTTALTLAHHLAAHPAVAAVNHPALPGHPQRHLATGQMSGGGGLLSFEVTGGSTAAEHVISALALPARTQSLGGIRSTVIRPAALWSHKLTDDQQSAAGIPPGLIRLSVGLEHEDDLIADLDNALGG